MARREYENKGGGLPEGCVLWLPFTSATDLKDRVTGNDVVIDRPEFMYWDDTQQAFAILKGMSTSYGYAAHLSYPDFRNQFSDDNYSVIVDVARGSGLTGINYLISPGGSYSDFIRRIWSMQRSYLPSLNTKCRVCFLCDATYKTVYYDAVQKEQVTADTRRNIFPPSKWPALASPEIMLGHPQLYIDFYIYNLMIFNRKLTIEEAMSL